MWLLVLSTVPVAARARRLFFHCLVLFKVTCSLFYHYKYCEWNVYLLVVACILSLVVFTWKKCQFTQLVLKTIRSGNICLHCTSHDFFPAKIEGFTAGQNLWTFMLRTFVIWYFEEEGNEKWLYIYLESFTNRGNETIIHQHNILWTTPWIRVWFVKKRYFIFRISIITTSFWTFLVTSDSKVPSVVLRSQFASTSFVKGLCFIETMSPVNLSAVGTAFCCEDSCRNHCD